MTSLHLPEFDPTAALPDGTLLLEASAGTGKTYTITSLVLRAVAELGIELEQLLVVTFTRAAAAELRGRIRGRLTAAVVAVAAAADAARQGRTVDAAALADGDAIIEHLIDGVDVDGLTDRTRRLRTAAEELDQATIDTIHGFCNAALHRAAPDVAVELDLELAEDVTDLLDELVHDALVRELRDAPEAWYRLLTDRGIGPDRLREVARRLEAEPHLVVVPDRTPAADPRQDWADAVQSFRDRWAAQRDDLVAWLKDHAREGFAGTYYNQKRPDKEAEALDAWCGGPLPSIGAFDDDIDKRLTYVSRSQMAAKAEHAGALPDHLDVIDAADALLGAPSTLATDVLLRFAATVRTELPRRKAQRGILSFGDLLLRLSDALADEATTAAVRAGIRSRFAMALIDEFQDTDPVQWHIFDRVFGADARLQLVGDPKQAIYAFRGADVGTYLDVVDQVPDDRRYTLRTNFRSDARYLDAIGQLFDPSRFGPDGPFAVADIPFVPVRATDAHQQDRLTFPDGPRPPLTIRYVPRELAVEGDGQDPPELLTKGWAWPALTRTVVDEIVTFLSSGVTLPADDVASSSDGDARRPVGPGDVAVLVRTNRQAQRMQAALLDAGVPAVLESDASVLHTPEATAVQRLLDALLRPSSERVVRPALLGPLIGIDPIELDQADDDAWDAWSESLGWWATLWREQGIAVALRRIMDEQAAASAALRRLRGERTLTNLLHLREVLHRVEVAERLGPQGLAAWLREQRHATDARADDRQLRLESDADAVTVVTIHRAKGLQYGVVWCPFLWEGRRLRGAAASVLRFRDPDSRELVLDVTVDVADKPLAKARKEREDWEEGLRLLYVALTRAEHRCVIHTGPFNGSGASPLARLLHGADASDGELPTDPKDRSDDDLFGDLRALASDEIEVARVEPPGPVVRWQRGDVVVPELRVRSFARDLDLAWQRTSFSRLSAGESQPPRGTPRDEGRDHDHQAPEGARSSSEDDAAPLALGDFPRGAQAGTFLHELLEHLDFQADADGTAAVVTERLRRSPFGTGADGPDPVGLTAAIRGVLATPLGPLFAEASLAGIARTDRLDELAFDLPLAGGYAAGERTVSLADIADVAEQHAAGSALPLTRFATSLRQRRSVPVRGFLTGSIDLVARIGGVDGRYLLADYKSNWLGAGERTTVADYHPDRLAEAMLAGDYLLQASLYLVALHRFLRQRLPGYDYDRHVAGFGYLFLRGMVGERTPRADDGTPHGVFAAKPSRAFVEDLDAVLRGADA